MGQAFCCIQVDQSYVAIKETFGKFEEVLTPGCHFLPWILGQQVAGFVPLRVQQLDIRCETKTKDNVFVTVVASVHYQALADKAADTFYKLTDTRKRIQSYVFDVIHARVPKLNLDDVFEQKNDIAKVVKDELEKVMPMYGYMIVETLIVDIKLDDHTKRTMNETNAAARLVEKIPGMSPKDIMDTVLVSQHLDTMKDICASLNSNSTIIPHAPGALKDMATMIRDSFLPGQSAISSCLSV